MVEGASVDDAADTAAGGFLGAFECAAKIHWRFIGHTLFKKPIGGNSLDTHF